MKNIFLNLSVIKHGKPSMSLQDHSTHHSLLIRNRGIMQFFYRLGFYESQISVNKAVLPFLENQLLHSSFIQGPISNSVFFVHFSHCGNVFMVTLQLIFRKFYFLGFGGYWFFFTLSEVSGIVLIDSLSETEINCSLRSPEMENRIIYGFK